MQDLFKETQKKGMHFDEDQFISTMKNNLPEVIKFVKRTFNWRRRKQFNFLKNFIDAIL